MRIPKCSSYDHVHCTSPLLLCGYSITKYGCRYTSLALLIMSKSRLYLLTSSNNSIMENTIQKTHLSIWKKKILSSMMVFSLIVPVFIPLLSVDATVIDGGNTLLWANTNHINFANSGAYAVNYTLNGTLDVGNTVAITGTDSSGNTLMSYYTSGAGWESTGALTLDYSSWLWQQGTITYTGSVYSGGIATPVVASGMTLTTVLDTVAPVVMLSGSATVTITQNTTYTESGATWTDMIDGSGVLMLPMSGSVNTAVVWTYMLNYWKVDAANNTSSVVSRTVNVVSNTDITSPVVTITSHMSGAVVTGAPVISGNITDTGWIASVTVNNSPAIIETWTWYYTLSGLTLGANTITVIATDIAGNTGSTSTVLNRVVLTSAVTSVLSGATSSSVQFTTDLSSTGILRYGTASNMLSSILTWSVSWTQHTFDIIWLAANTIYYYTVEGQWGIVSPVYQFKTPVVVSIESSGSIIANSSVYISGSTLTGAVFNQTGIITILSLTSPNSRISFSLSGLSITAVWGSWDGVIQAPETTGQSVPMTLSWYAWLGNAYQIGNSESELLFTGQLVTVTVRLSSTLAGQIARVFHSLDGGLTYTELTTCAIGVMGDCTFTTNQLSLFAFAVPVDTIPDAFSFTTLTSQELSTSYLSNTVTIAGITAPAPISITWGQYSINGGVFTTLPGTVSPGDAVVLRLLSSASYATTTTTTLTIGWVTSGFSVVTKSSGGGSGGGSIGPGGPGGGWSSSLIDLCPYGDTSGSLYDSLCIPTTTPGNIATPIFTGSFTIPGIILTDDSIRFRDIRGNWAEYDIKRLALRGVIDNVLHYNPDASLTRAEFLKIVILTTGWTIPATGLNTPFNDVPDNSWYERYTSLALSKGMIQSANRFRPNDPISRAEATKILTIVLWVTVNEATTMTFVDVSRNSTLVNYIEATVYLNIFSGQLRNWQRIFRPSDAITRAEIAKVIVNTFWF